MTGAGLAAVLRWAAAAVGGAAVYLALAWLAAGGGVRQRAGLRLLGRGSAGRAAADQAPVRLGAEVEGLGALAGWTGEQLAGWHRRRRAWTALGAVGGTALGLLAGEAPWAPGGWVPAALAGGAAWWLAGWRLRDAAWRRQADLRRQLPAVLERYVLGVTAGLSVRQALRLAAERSGGPLGDLLERVVRRLDLGADLRRAIEPELPGVETGPVRLVLTALMQAERLGSSLVETAREQAEFVRLLAGYEAERAVDALPLKLMACTIVFLFPPVIVVVLLPNLLLFLRSQW